MRILAVIISYYPDRDLLKKDLDSFVDHVDEVIIWENTPAEERLAYRLDGYVKVRYMGTGQNIGISKALNQARKYAIENGFDALLTMDQDSVWEGFGSFVDTVSREDTPFGIYGPAVYSEAIENEFAEAFTLITSGMLVPVEVFRKIGGYEEDFFVDGIDLDFCCKAHDAGIPVWSVGHCRLVQKFGGKRKVRFLGRYPEVYDYSPSRLYGTFRSQTILNRKYRSARERSGNFYRHTFFYRVPKILLFEKNGWSKVRAIIRGIKDGKAAKID